jgi:diadenosine tetraphosphate (Ap4A) HIT family hydrolase
MRAAPFVADGAFAKGASPLLDLALCQVWLQSDRRFPWLVLIPRRPGLRELEDLTGEDRATFLAEIVLAGAAVRAMGAAAGRPVEKLNIGLLGNITAQLHAHVVGRRSDDAAWPGPVWGHGVALAYDGATDAAMRGAAFDILRPLQSNGPLSALKGRPPGPDPAL